MAARKKFTKRKPPIRNKGRYGKPDPRTVFHEKKVKKLDMGKTEEFNYMLSKAVQKLPDSIRGSIAGGIYAIASRQGINEARDFITKKREEGILDENMQRQISLLLGDYSTYR